MYLQNNLRRPPAQLWEVLALFNTRLAVLFLPFFFCSIRQLGFCSRATLYPIEKITNTYATNKDKSGVRSSICWVNCCISSLENSAAAILIVNSPVSVVQTALSMLKKGGLAGIYGWGKHDRKLCIRKILGSYTHWYVSIRGAVFAGCQSATEKFLYFYACVLIKVRVIG